MKRYFMLLNLLLITGMIYFGVKGAYKTLAAQLDYHDPVTEAADKGEMSSENRTSHPLAYYNTIIDRNLFNTKDKEEVEDKEEEEPEETEPEETKLNLKLWGTVSGSKGRTYAVIEDKKERKQNLYREGDMIQSAIIKRIDREQVLLSVNNRDEILKMEEPKSSSAPLPKKIERPRAKKRKARSRNIKISRSEIEEAMSDVTELMKGARIKPHRDGLAMSSVKRNSIFRKLGLRSGDILTGVDETPIKSADDALKLYDSLKSESEVNLNIKRRGREQTIKYNIEE